MALTKIKKGQIDPGVLGSNKTLTKSADYTITAADIDGVSHLFVHIDSTSGLVEITLPTASDMSGMLITFWHETSSNGMQIHKQPTPSAGYYYSVQVDDWITITSDGSSYLKMGNVMTVPGP